MSLKINYKSLSVYGAIAIFIGLYLSSLYNYLLFHSLAEFFSIAIACSLFLIAWNSEKYFTSSYFAFLGVAYLFIGGLDMLHTLSYKGMHIFTDYDYYANQIWIVARYMESLSFLFAFQFLHTKKKLKMSTFIIGYLSVTAFFIVSIFVWRIFPVCFIQGYGLTIFKKISEYIICLILTLDIFLMYKHKTYFQDEVYKYLLWSLVFTIASELCFTLYISNYDIISQIGHYFKIISFYLLYKSIVETGIKKPYDIIFRELKLNEEKLKQKSLTDEMTGLYNRRAGIDFLDKMIKMATRAQESLTIGFVDIDGLKFVNDRYGHNEGDFLIKKIAEVLKQSVRDSDVVCRIGGDEFLIILPGCRIENAKDMIKRAYNILTEFNNSKVKQYIMDFSIGFSEYNGQSTLDVDLLLEEADNEMYLEKRDKKYTKK